MNKLLLIPILCLAVIADAAPDKSGVKPSVLSLPSGPGSIEGLGESFEPQLNTGTSVYSVKIQVPPGVASHQPDIALSYNSGSGNGIVGIGWSLDFPKIARQADKGTPDYSFGDDDVYLYGGEELVPLSDGTYRCENESAFTRIRPVDEDGRTVSSSQATAVGWEATTRDGKRLIFGHRREAKITNPYKRQDHGDNRLSCTYLWALESWTDTNGNEIKYTYAEFNDSPGVLYPTHIEYAQFGQHSHSISFQYTPEPGWPGARPDVFSDFRPGFECKTSRRLLEIRVETDGKLVRRYALSYQPEPDLTPHGSDSAFSLLQKIIQFDRSEGNANYLPPIRFAYTPFQPSSTPFRLVHPGGLARNWGPGLSEVCDINADGLPDYIATGSLDEGHIAYLNQGDDQFSASVPFASSNNLRLDSGNVTLADMDGNGLSDLIQRTPFRILMFPNENGFQKITPLGPGASLEWGPQIVLADETNNPAFVGFDQADTRMMDVDFDKRTDVMVTYSEGVKYYLNTASGWKTLQARQDNGYLPTDWSFNSARFDQSNTALRRTDLADLNGDRLQDWVLISKQDDQNILVKYWANAGSGRWIGPLQSLRLANGEYPVLPDMAALTDVRLMDVNQDGLSDLVVTGRRSLTYSLNLGGNTWGEPTKMVSPPNNPTVTEIRALDMNGNGSTDLLWDNHRNLSDLQDQNSDSQVTVADAYSYYDFIGDIKPNQLSIIDNGIGRRTTIEYKSSTEDYLAAIAVGQPWTTKLPFPVQVVSRITVDIGLDLNGDGKKDEYITDLTYRDGYYDSFEKEFRGFAYVQKVQRGDDYDPSTGITARKTGEVSGPSLVTRHRFLTGSPDGADNDDYPSNYLGTQSTDEGSGTGLPFTDTLQEEGGREEESLKGKPVFVETIDPAVLSAPDMENAEFHSSARASALAAYENPFAPAAQKCTPDKYVYTRVHTDWKVRRLYRPSALNNPTGRFSVTSNVGKSISFAFTETTDTELIEANGLFQGLFDNKPVPYPQRDPKVTRSVAIFDDYGNQILDNNYGVYVPGNGSAQDDERVKKTTFVLDEEALQNWIIGKPAVETVLDEKGNFVAETRHYYDGVDLQGLPLGTLGKRGLEKRTENVVTSDASSLLALETFDRAKIDLPGDPRLPSSSVVQEKRIAHDIYGNAIVVMDPLGNPADVTLLPSLLAPLSAQPQPGHQGHFRILTYDSERHVYPTEERIVLGEGKDDLVLSAGYDPGFGVITQSTDFNGNVTEYAYDSFARLTGIVEPFDSKAFPTQAFAYRMADPHRHTAYIYDASGNLTLSYDSALSQANAVLTYQREQHGQPGTFDTIQYTSGNGQKLLALEEDEQDGRWVVKEAKRYNLRGSEAATYQPYYRADNAFHLTGAQGVRHDGKLVTDWDRIEKKLDATGREIKTVNPPEKEGGERLFAWVQNLPLEKRTFDEEDTRAGKYGNTPLVHYQDGLERLVQVDEITRLSGEGLPVTELQTWTTRYDYDLNDNLVWIQDSQNNQKWMRYDGLGRKIFMNDPDRGVMLYTYDAASNLSETVDAKQQKITYAYDGVNRLLSEDYWDAQNKTPDVSYLYDAPAGLISLGDGRKDIAKQTKGYLSYITDLSGEEHNSYDERGRVKWVVKRIPDPQTQVMVSYKTEMEYDAFDRATKLIYPDNDQVTYTYNNRNLLESVNGGQTVNLDNRSYIIGDIDYNPSGQLKQSRYGNGVISKYAYDPRLRMNSLITTPENNPDKDKPFISYAYTFDGASNITRIDDLRPESVHPAGDKLRNTQIFTYDDLYRITGAKYSFNLPGQPDRNDGSIQYHYDRIGNMLAQTSDIDHMEKGKSVTHHGDMTYGGNTGRQNRLGRQPNDAPGPHALTGTESGRNYPYDANGNMTNIDGLVSTWDFKDRLVQVEDEKIRARYTYDYTDRRISKTVWDKSVSSSSDDIKLSTTTIYIDKFFEVREHDQPVKYVWNGETRVAQITGTLESQSERVQRLRLYKGWNLVSIAVEADNELEQLGLGTNPAIQNVFLWNSADKAYTSLQKGMGLATGSVLWIKSNQNVQVEIKGRYSELTSLSVNAGGDYVPFMGFQAVSLDRLLPPQVENAWSFNSVEQTWKRYLSAVLSFLTNTTHFSPGQGMYIIVNETLDLIQPQKEREIVYYNIDHIKSSNVMTNENGSKFSECVFYPFGFLRMSYKVISDIGNDYMYAGKEIDSENGLGYFETRYLLLTSNVFCSVDNLISNMEISERKDLLNTPGKLNSYIYVSNKPLIEIDPNGREGVCFQSDPFSFNPNFAIGYLLPINETFTSRKNDREVVNHTYQFGIKGPAVHIGNAGGSSGVFVNVTHTKGGNTNPYVRPTAVAKLTTIIERLKSSLLEKGIKLESLTLSGGSEEGHSVRGNFTHGNGYKVDIYAINNELVSRSKLSDQNSATYLLNEILGKMKSNGDIRDYVRVGASGHRDHFDVQLVESNQRIP